MMQKQPASYEGVALVAPVSIPYTRFSPHGAPWFFGRALGELIKKSGISKQDIDGLAASSFSLAPDSVISLTEHFSLIPRWIEQVPLGGASGIVALRRAARAVQSGDADIIACIGADTNKEDGFKELVENFSSFSSAAAYPYGAAGPNGVFALITQHYMDQYSTQREDFGRLCLSQRRNAAQYPHALLQKPMSMEDYLSARPIAGPLHLFDCVMPCAGAEAFLVMSVERAKSLKQPFAIIKSADELHNAYHDDPVQFRAGWDIFAPGLYERAGLGPTDMDLLYTYDDYPVISMMQMEDLGFCKKGEAAQFVKDNPLTIDGGGLVHNSSGGQLSCGQAGAAAGYMGVVEAMRQLAGKAQTALVSGYGMVNYDRGLCSAAAILTKGDGS